MTDPVDRVGKGGIYALVAYHLSLGLLLIVSLIGLIHLRPPPPVEPGATVQASATIALPCAADASTLQCWLSTTNGEEVWFLLVVIVAGAMGAYLHATTSLVDYIGNEQLARNWIPFYLARPPIGMTLAGIFYLLLRGGLFTSGVSQGELNVFGFAAIAALAGMFSKQATDKLRELFDALWRTASPVPRQQPLEPQPAPTIASCDPNAINRNNPVGVLHLKGSGFRDGQTATVNGVEAKLTVETESSITIEFDVAAVDWANIDHVDIVIAEGELSSKPFVVPVAVP